VVNLGIYTDKNGRKIEINKKLNHCQLSHKVMDKIIKFVIAFIAIGTVVHFVINDDPLNFDWAFECKKTLATVGC
jgi:hypothetical protein